MAKNDRFANIATTSINTKNKQLVNYYVRKETGKYLAFSEKNSSGISHLFMPEQSPKEELEMEIAKLHEEYAPFLCDFTLPVMERERLDFDSFQWRISTKEDRQNFISTMAGAGEWEDVSIPHYGGPIGKAETIYRTTFHMTALPEDDKACFLCFDGVDYIAHVYLNGKLLGSHEGFFAHFEFDCTHNLVYGENVLVITVENDFVHVGNAMTFSGEEFTGDKIYAATGPGYDDPQVGWHHCPPGMGIYQPVYLEKRSRQFVSDMYVRPMPEESRVELYVDVFHCDVGCKEVRFDVSIYGKNFEQTIFEHRIMTPIWEKEPDQNKVFEQASAIFAEPVEGKLERILLAEKGVNYYKFVIPMMDFKWWDPSSPWLYQVQIGLLDENGKILDQRKCNFGMRSFVIDTESEVKGMLYLNGHKCRLRGANTMGFEQQDVMHEDYEQLIYDLLMAKACHMNFLRITQRPVQDIIYDYCDMLGMMVQTDLPLFGALRRNKFAEALRETEEMERLIRKHPCAVMISYINEPAPDQRGKPHLFVSREELDIFFEMADKMVHLHNPDRVIKHVEGDYDPPRTSLQDGHCYTCWYNGFGVDAGSLNKGDWIPVKENWYYTCGEYGAEGLEDVSFMRRHYPESWLPQTAEEEKNWSPGCIIGCQSGEMHYMFFETPHTLQEWVEWSQEYQAEATKWMTEAFRRDERMVSFAIHLFIDAFPSGWLKSLVDCERNPKPAFYTYRNGLTPTMISIRTDRLSTFTGQEANVEFWLCNDDPEDKQDLRMHYLAVLPDARQYCGEVKIPVNGSDVCYVGECLFPVGNVEGEAKIFSVLTDKQGKILHRNNLVIQVRNKECFTGTKYLYTPNENGKAYTLVKEIGAEFTDEASAECILIDDVKVYVENKERMDAFVQKGGKLIFMELPTGLHKLGDIQVEVKKCFMSPRHFVSKDTGHRWVKNFDRKAFKHWYEREQDRITPIAESTFVSEDVQPVLISGNTDKEGHWEKTMVVGEYTYEKGSMVICQLKLAGRLSDNSAAWNFAVKMLQ